MKEPPRRFHRAAPRTTVEPPAIFAAAFFAGALFAGAVLPGAPAALAASDQDDYDLPETGRELYTVSCAACHGADGRGESRSQVGFDVPLPDFTDCDFAYREPDPDWVIVAQLGGPSRGFSSLMPAFAGVLTVEETQMILNHVRTFCTDKSWPRGDLNLPRALVTEKAFPEDEAVFNLAVNTEGPGAVTGQIIYEQRFGPRNQVEILAPFGWKESGTTECPEASCNGTDWGSGVGDLAVAVKHCFYHSLDKGAIMSAVAEVVFPTGDEARGYGSGTYVLEPFLTYGQILPSDFFLHSQAGVGISFDTSRAENEGFVRLALGRSFTAGFGGRTWSPMVELLAGGGFEEGSRIDLDAVPQMQVTLNTRQHVMMNAGVRLPVNNTTGRHSQVIVYLLWDWFDGSLFEGW